MERHKCKLCFRVFSNGRSLGGHMRSHLATASQLSDPTESTSSLTSEESENREKIMAYGLRENPKKSFKLMDPEFLDDGYNAQNRASETESTRIRSKTEARAPKRPKRTKPTSNESVSEIDPVSSVSDSFSTEEEIALCLMMLSRDSNGLKLSPTRFVPRGNNVSVKDVNQRVYECPFCERVFGSGQALGGHKRSHFLPLGASRIAGSDSGKEKECLVPEKIDDFGYGLIDLNLPAPMEDEDYTIDNH